MLASMLSDPGCKTCTAQVYESRAPKLPMLLIAAWLLKCRSSCNSWSENETAMLRGIQCLHNYGLGCNNAGLPRIIGLGPRP